MSHINEIKLDLARKYIYILWTQNESYINQHNSNIRSDWDNLINYGKVNVNTPVWLEFGSYPENVINKLFVDLGFEESKHQQIKYHDLPFLILRMKMSKVIFDPKDYRDFIKSNIEMDLVTRLYFALKGVYDSFVEMKGLPEGPLTQEMLLNDVDLRSVKGLYQFNILIENRYGSGLDGGDFGPCVNIGTSATTSSLDVDSKLLIFEYYKDNILRSTSIDAERSYDTKKLHIPMSILDLGNERHHWSGTKRLTISSRLKRKMKLATGLPKLKDIMIIKDRSAGCECFWVICTLPLAFTIVFLPINHLIWYNPNYCCTHSLSNKDEELIIKLLSAANLID